MLRFLALLLLLICAAHAKLQTAKIIGGTLVQPGVFPDVKWQVGLIIQGSQLCGGAILDTLHIITAAHCVKDINTGVVTAPEHIHVRTGIDLNVVQIFRGQSVWVHPSYYAGNPHAVDMAVVKLNTPMGFSTAVQPIALPTSDPVPPSGNFIVSGYGTTVSDGSGSHTISSDLLWVDVPYVTYATCNAAAPFTVESTAVCAGGAPGKDSCQGDSGGPLVADLGTHWVLVGVVSTGTRVSNPLCAVANEYGIYAAVWPHRLFILDAINGVIPPDMSGAVPVFCLQRSC